MTGAGTGGLPWIATASSGRPDVAGTVAATPHLGGGDNVASAPNEPRSGQVASNVATPYITPVAPVLVATSADDEFEATVLHQATSATSAQKATPVSPRSWVLELATGETFPLGAGDIVVGRHPVATDGATPLRLPDPSRKLSRTHARLRHDNHRDMWTVEDLGSSNGVATFNNDTHAFEEATPGQPVDVAEYLRIGTLKARLRRDSIAVGAVATSGDSATGTGDATPAATS
ncbi:FHA domain-containing protein [Leucobacter celer]|uniref:FHA domain-containing protein n=1 Tax=Leucobacter celer TaxID=668625 RepID=UPI0006A7720F|nr:FHA domain-containing protein [Leucobacter celer]